MGQRTRPGRGQLELDFGRGTRGGVRARAGRKRLGGRPGVPHRRRPELSRNHPVHVTIRCRESVGRLRTHRSVRGIRRCLGEGHRPDFAVVEFSVATRELNLLVEADDRAALGRGMQGLQIRLARRLNRVLGRTGPVFAGRYRARILRNSLEVKRTLLGLLSRSSRVRSRPRAVRGSDDPYTSAATFGGWHPQAKPRARDGPVDEVVIRPARTWLLRVGWRRHGLLRVDEGEPIE